MNTPYKYQTTYDNWIEDCSGKDLLRHMLRYNHHSNTDIYKNKIYLSYAVGFKYLTSGNLLNRPTLAKALRGITYPAIGETLFLDDELFSDENKGIDNLIYCATYLKQARDNLFIKKIEADKHANNLIMHYEDNIESPLIRSHSIIPREGREKNIICLDIAGVNYYLVPDYYSTEDLVDDTVKEIYIINNREFFYKTVYNRVKLLKPIGYIKNSPFLQFFARNDWKNKGHTFWLDLETRYITRSINTVKNLSKKYTDRPEIIELKEENIVDE